MGLWFANVVDDWWGIGMEADGQYLESEIDVFYMFFHLV